MTAIEYVDSHTGGEPTRTLIAGIPDLGPGPVSQQLEILRRDYDHLRSTAVNEPRGSDVIVGALLLPNNGVIFFNNVGYLGMCGHGAIGVIATLAYLGRIQPGDHILNTPVGPVTATLHPDGQVSIANVPSYRQTQSLTVEIEGLGPVTGDVAWGGNWFYIVHHHTQPIEIANVDQLTDTAWRIRQAVNRVAPQVDHIELCAGNRNFVLCPGKAYDRSPCGTGTSAKLACLAADGKLAEGEIWRQESIVGSVFEATYTSAGNRILPTIKGRAWISAHGKLLLDPTDPFIHGIRP